MPDFDSFYRGLVDSQGLFFLEASLESLPGTPITAKQGLEVFGIFQKKSMELLKHAEVLSIHTLYLAPLIPDDIAIDHSFKDYANLAIKGMQNSQNTAEERLFFELACACLILSGSKLEALDFLIRQLCLKDSAFLTHYSAFVDKLLDYLQIPFSLPQKILVELLSPPYFLTLTPKVQRNILNAQLHLLWNVKTYFASKAWLDLYPTYKDLFKALLEDGQLDSALFTQFMIYHVCGNAFSQADEWADFNTNISALAARFYPKLLKIETQKRGKDYPSFNPEESHKIVIGVLKDRLVENSPFKVECSLFAMLLKHQAFRDRFIFKVFSMDYDEKSPNDLECITLLENLGQYGGFEGGIEVISINKTLPQDLFYQSHLEKALKLKEILYAHRVHILISPNNGYGISDFLLATRSAPVQIYYSHGNKAYCLDTLEGYITHIAPTIGLYQEGDISYLGIYAPMLSFFYNPPLDNHSQRLIEKTRALYAPDTQTQILGTIGRLTKLDSLEFLQSVLEILQQAPKAIYLACGIGDQKAILEKLKALCLDLHLPSDLLNRFQFIGYVNAHLYGHVIDLFLDTFPMHQGESKSEFMGKNKLVLTLSESTPEERINAFEKFVKTHFKTLEKCCEDYHISLDEYQKAYHYESQSVIAFNPKDYVNKALKLLSVLKNPNQLSSLLQQRSMLRAITGRVKSNQSIMQIITYLEHFLDKTTPCAI
ncbi:glycosyltransferase family 4 protein [Helicobacter suis]|uniref:glycosyltransferase family 4 protein n=1 Tax=Helicobacter suis TaxID=104628 RepID=UPI0013D5EAFA|nr:glycosyltransferase family 4 protein [Helicobacter suis]